MIATRRQRRSVPVATLVAAAACLACAGPARAAAVDWITAGNSFWDIASNWSPGLPGAGDDARVDVAGARVVTVRASGGTVAVNSLVVAGDDSLAITGGTLVVHGVATAANPAGTSTLARLVHSGGSLDGAGRVVVTGPASLTGGQHAGSGTTVLQGTSTLSGFNLDAGRVLRNEGSATLTGGMNLNASSAAGASRIDNAAGALIDVRTFNLGVTASSFAGDSGDGAAIHNAGSFRKSTSGGYAINVPFHNAAGGLIDVQAGSFAFNAGASHAGRVQLASGSALTLGGRHDVVAGAVFTGAGSLTLAGAATVLDFDAATTIESAYTMSGGTVSGAALTLAGPVSIAISSSLGVMSGPATTTLKGSSSVGGGANNPFGLDAGRVLRNEGTMTITGVLDLNRLATAGSGRIENAAGGVIEVATFNQSIHATSFAGDDGSDARLDNAGVFRKPGSGGYTVAVPFHNRAGGLIDVQAGSFSFSAGSSHVGTVTLASGAALNFNGGTHAIGSGARFEGPGTVALAGAATVLRLDADTTIDARFTMTGGTLGGAALVLRGPYALTMSTFGVLRGATTTTLAGNGTLSGGPNNPFGLDAGHVLRNEGSMVITGVLDLNRSSEPGAGRIVNAAGALIDVKTFNQSIFARDWSATQPGDSGADARLDNAGTLRKSTSGTYGVQVPVFNTGTVEVLAGAFSIPTFANAGTVDLAAGTSLQLSATGLVNQGRIQGEGSVVAPGTGLVNAGVIAPGHSPGELTIQGDLQMASDGLLQIELAGAAHADRLVVTGTAALGGTLEVVRLTGYTPSVGDSFVVMAFGGREGSTFEHVVFSGFGGGVQFDVHYLDSQVLLGVTAVPEPASWALFGAGLLALVGRRVGRVVADAGGPPGPRP